MAFELLYSSEPEFLRDIMNRLSEIFEFDPGAASLHATVPVERKESPPPSQSFDRSLGECRENADAASDVPRETVESPPRETSPAENPEKSQDVESPDRSSAGKEGPSGEDRTAAGNGPNTKSPAPHGEEKGKRKTGETDSQIRKLAGRFHGDSLVRGEVHIPKSGEAKGAAAPDTPRFPGSFRLRKMKEGLSSEKSGGKGTGVEQKSAGETAGRVETGREVTEKEFQPPWKEIRFNDVGFSGEHDGKSRPPEGLEPGSIPLREWAHRESLSSVTRPVPENATVRHYAEWMDLREQITDKLGNRIQLLIDNQDSRARIKLYPPELGKIDVHLSIRNNQLDASIFTQNQLVRETVLSQMNQLKSLMENNGFSQVQINVDVDESGRDTEDEWAGREGTKTRRFRDLTLLSGELDEEAVRTGTLREWSTGTLGRSLNLLI